MADDANPNPSGGEMRRWASRKNNNLGKFSVKQLGIFDRSFF
jgi:hypothetical protein